MLNVAVIGLGWWGRVICASLAGSDRLRVVRGVDVVHETATAFGRTHGFPVSKTLDDTLADPEVQAVILATPHSQHEEQIIAAAKAGRHVCCEKPLTLTRAGAARAVAACRAAGVTLAVGHERRFEPPLIELKRMVTSGELGTILQVEANYGHNILAAVDPADWRASATESPGAGLTGIGSHLLDAYTDIFGPIAEVRALSARRVTQRAGGDVLSVQFSFVDGAFGYFGNTSASPFYGRLCVYGSKGWAESRARQHMQEGGVSELTVCGLDGHPATREWPPVDTVLANLEAFADAAAGCTANRYDGAQMIHTVAILEAIVRSIASRRPELVETESSTPERRT